MRLRSQLSLVFGAVSLASVGTLAWILERTFVGALETQVRDDLKISCELVKREVRSTLETQAREFETSCSDGSLGDRAEIAVETGEFLAKRTAFASQFALDRSAKELRDLALFRVDQGSPEPLLADPSETFGELSRPGSPRLKEVATLLGTVRGRTTFVHLQADATAWFGCSPRASRKLVIVASRPIEPILANIGRALAATITVSPSSPDANACILPALSEKRGVSERTTLTQSLPLSLRVVKSRAAIDRTIEESRQAIVVVAALAVGLTLLVSFLLARALTRSLERVTHGVRLLAEENPKELEETGSNETRALAHGFNQLLRSLAAAREKLLGATKLAAWRDAARKIAHEIKNPLTPIRASVETLRRLHKRNDPQFEEYFDEATDTILREVKRMSDLATEFSTFAQMPKPKVEQVDAVTLVAEQVTLFRNAHPEIRFDLDAAGPKDVHWDHGQISQVVHNLIKNAVDALGMRAGNSGGVDVARIVVRVRERTPGEGGTTLMIDVEDSGPGIPDEHRPKLFEPYFTNKPTGTGLGLSISLHIAQEHGGTLSLLPDGERTSTTLSGAVFRLELPAG